MLVPHTDLWQGVGCRGPADTPCSSGRGPTHLVLPRRGARPNGRTWDGQQGGSARPLRSTSGRTATPTVATTSGAMSFGPGPREPEQQQQQQQPRARLLVSWDEGDPDAPPTRPTGVSAAATADPAAQAAAARLKINTDLTLVGGWVFRREWGGSGG